MQSVDLQMVGVCVLPKVEKVFTLFMLLKLGAPCYTSFISSTVRESEMSEHMCWTGHQQGGIISTPTVILSEKTECIYTMTYCLEEEFLYNYSLYTWLPL